MSRQSIFRLLGKAGKLISVSAIGLNESYSVNLPADKPEPGSVLQITDENGSSIWLGIGDLAVGEVNVDLTPVLNAIAQYSNSVGQALDAFDINYFQPSIDFHASNAYKLDQLLARPSAGVTDLTPVQTQISSVQTYLENLLDNIESNFDINQVSLDEIKAKVLTLNNTDLSSIQTTLAAIQTKTNSLQNADLSPLTTKVDSNANKLDQLLNLLTIPGGNLQLITTPYTITRSSILAGTSEPTYDSLTDSSSTTGWVSSTGSTESLTIDLGTELRVRAIQVGGGTIGGVNIGNAVNGSSIQYSLNGATWTTFVAISGVENSQASGNQFPIFSRTGITARYWRLLDSGQCGTTLLRLYA